MVYDCYTNVKVTVHVAKILLVLELVLLGNKKEFIAFIVSVPMLQVNVQENGRRYLKEKRATVALDTDYQIMIIIIFHNVRNLGRYKRGFEV